MLIAPFEVVGLFVLLYGGIVCWNSSDLES